VRQDLPAIVSTPFNQANMSVTNNSQPSKHPQYPLTVAFGKWYSVAVPLFRVLSNISNARKHKAAMTLRKQF
jgi:hypothetical protein